MLVKLSKDQLSWDKHLDACTFAYNTSRQDSTKFTPFELMFGRKAVLPVELQISQVDPESALNDFQAAAELQSNSTALEKLIEARSLIIENAKENITAAQKKQKKHYDRKHATPGVYKIGTKVLVKNFTRKKKKTWQNGVPLDGSICYPPQ